MKTDLTFADVVLMFDSLKKQGYSIDEILSMKIELKKTKEIQLFHKRPKVEIVGRFQLVVVNEFLRGKT